jgi:hypothetical protein
MNEPETTERGPSWKALLAVAVVLATVLVVFSHLTHIG